MSGLDQNAHFGTLLRYRTLSEGIPIQSEFVGLALIASVASVKEVTADFSERRR